ncbi:MAG: alpha-glucuronidase [Muribaculaceae bacterium]|nr:alpha-glucuronidase [Muribaculaceae bacterium]
MKFTEMILAAAVLCAVGCSSSSTGADNESEPAFNLRLLNHWDNLDGTIERGYAGRSLWDWQSLPDSISPRYADYAKLCSSVGINGTVLNNVNASAKILSTEYLEKVAALADIFRDYGIKVYLSVNFASPMLLDSLGTADPLDPGVQGWWGSKVDEIYELIPDFGGFLVKANSEGQPGPCDFGRTHVEGANMLARELARHDGIVMWRAFVYSPGDADRAKQAYQEFKPLDGQFDDNVIVQIKNGPIDFQPREPFSPLLLAMEHTATMPELQITQEYLGHSNHLAYLGTMWEEFFSLVPADSQSGIAGVANIGDAGNFTAHPFARANLYAFGRLACDPSLSARDIAREWVELEIKPTTDASAERIVDMMMRSREAVVDYMMPMGLHHLFAYGHHYGPEPWCDVEGARPDWLPSFYHRADSIGLGFDRSPSGSNASAQYPEPYATMYASIDTCPEEYLLWFHHVPWGYKLKSGDTMWNTLCRHYQRGCDEVEAMIADWKACEQDIADKELYADVLSRLETQSKDARWWKDGCLLYFQTFSKMPFPDDVSAPTHTLEQLKSINLGIDNYTCPSPELLDSLR